MFDRVVNTPLLCTGFNTEKYKTEKFRIRNCAGKIINQYGEGMMLAQLMFSSANKIRRKISVVETYFSPLESPEKGQLIEYLGRCFF